MPTTTIGILLAAFSFGFDDADFLGVWSMETSFQGRAIPAKLTLARDGDAIDGRWSSQGREFDLTDIAIEGDTISFVRAMQGQEMTFRGTFAGETLEGTWATPFGDHACTGERVEDDGATSRPETEPDLHDRPIRTEDGRTLLWAREHEDGTIEWFDVTDMAIDPKRFQFGIGKDSIASIDEPVFVAPDDPKLAERGVTATTPVLGVEIDGVTRAYPVDIMSMHEIVNDEIAGKPYAVMW